MSEKRDKKLIKFIEKVKDEAFNHGLIFDVNDNSGQVELLRLPTEEGVQEAYTNVQEASKIVITSYDPSELIEACRLK